MTRSFRFSVPVLLAATFLIPLWLQTTALAAEPTPGEASPVPGPEVIGPPLMALPPPLDVTPEAPPPTVAPPPELNLTPVCPGVEPIASTAAEAAQEGAPPTSSPQAETPRLTAPAPEIMSTVALLPDISQLPPPSDEPVAPAPDPPIESAPPAPVDAESQPASPTASSEAMPSDAPPAQPSASANPTDMATPSTLAPTDTPTGFQTPTPTETILPTSSPTASPTPTETLLPTSSPTVSPTPTETLTPTSSPTASLTPSPTLLLRVARSFAPGALWINEVAWAGTLASSSDEWIELYNPGTEPVDLAGWRLTDGGDLDRTLAGMLAPGGYYLLERTDDATVSDVPADLTYTGSLRNEGEALELLDPSGASVDRANAGGGAWPAGDRTSRASMQRSGPDDTWDTYRGCGGNGVDAGGAPIQGTPRQANALDCVPPTPTGTATPTLTPSPASFPEGAVHINEIAWAGTHASASDEWIELSNPGPQAIDLADWRLTDGGDIDIPLSGLLQSGGFFLLERTDDQAVSDIRADMIYNGALGNDGEHLELLDPSGAVVDAANRQGGAWPAGDDESRASMERKESGGWGTFTGYFGNGRDAGGNHIAGTPRQPNSLLFPTPSPTGIPGEVVINEVLIRPHYDWEGKGEIDVNDEFIELYNRGPRDVQLGGWILDDIRNGGSKPFVLPNRWIEADSYAVFFRSRTHLALNDSGDTVTLRSPNGHTVDTIAYLRVKAYNLAYGRLPDGSHHLAYGLWPTPGEANQVYTPPSFPVGSILISEVAWAGTLASANDEWIELWNPGEEAISLAGWAVTDDNDLWAPLTGILAPGGYYLLERTDDETISDLPADGIYRGALSDDGERLRLMDPSSREIDALNATGGWLGGNTDNRLSLERLAEEWLPFAGELGRGLDANDQPIRGTPGGANSRGLEAALAAGFSCSQGSAPAAGPCP